jgi:WD40 repeat protein
VRWLDDTALASAAPDGTLRLWDLRGALPPACSVLRGHANEAHAVALAATAGGYLAVGGEDNCVCVYHAGTAAPALRHALGGADAATGAGAPPPHGAYVSALAWRRDGAGLLAANSAGHMQLLRVVT